MIDSRVRESRNRGQRERRYVIQGAEHRRVRIYIYRTSLHIHLTTQILLKKIINHKN